MPADVLVRELPDGVRYELPTRDWGAWRWFGWACALVSVVSFAGLCVAIAHMTNASSPGTGYLIGFGILSASLVLFVILSLGAALATLASRGVIALHGGTLIRREHAGPFHRSHRRSIEHIRRLVIDLDPQAEDFDAATRKRLGGMAYTLRAVDSDDNAFRMARWYPTESLVPIAHDLAGRLAEMREHHFGITETLHVELAYEHRTDAEQMKRLSPIEKPVRTDIEIERAPDGVTIIVPRMRIIGGPSRSLTGIAMNGLAAAAIGLFIYSMLFAGWGGILSWVFLLLAFPAIGGWVGFLGERLGERETFIDIVEDTLLITTGTVRGPRVHEWPREKISDVKCGDSAIEIDDSPLPQLQIITSDDHTHRFFTGRTHDELRWLAYEIRAALAGKSNDTTEES